MSRSVNRLNRCENRPSQSPNRNHPVTSDLTPVTSRWLASRRVGQSTRPDARSDVDGRTSHLGLAHMADTAAGIAEANPRDSEMAADGDEASGELDVTLPGVSRTEYYIENTRGERLFCQEWHNEERHRGALLFIQHGYGSSARERHVP